MYSLAYLSIRYNLREPSFSSLFAFIFENLSLKYSLIILGLQSISGDVADNVSHPHRLDPTMQLITYSFVLYLQHGRHDVKCKYQ